MIRATDKAIPNFQYKKFNQILEEIRHSIRTNIQGHQHYDKLYFGESNYQTMFKYQLKKKALQAAIQQNSNRSQYKPKFKILNNNKSALSTDS